MIEETSFIPLSIEYKEYAGMAIPFYETLSSWSILQELGRINDSGDTPDHGVLFMKIKTCLDKYKNDIKVLESSIKKVDYAKGHDFNLKNNHIYLMEFTNTILKHGISK